MKHFVHTMGITLTLVSTLFSLSAMDQKTFPAVKRSNPQNLSKGSVRSFSTMAEQTLNKEDQSHWVTIFSPVIGDLVAQKELLKIEALSSILTKKIDVFTPSTAQQFFEFLQKLFKDNDSLFSQPLATKTKEFYEKLAKKLNVSISTATREQSSSLNEPRPSQIPPTQVKEEAQAKQSTKKVEDSSKNTSKAPMTEEVEKLKAELEKLRIADATRKAKKEAKKEAQRKKAVEDAQEKVKRIRKQLTEAEAECQRLREDYNKLFQEYAREDFLKKNLELSRELRRVISQSGVIDTETAIANDRAGDKKELKIILNLSEALLKYKFSLKKKHAAFLELSKWEQDARKEPIEQSQLAVPAPSNALTQEQNLTAEKIEYLKAAVLLQKLRLNSLASMPLILQECHVYKSLKCFETEVQEAICSHIRAKIALDLVTKNKSLHVQAEVRASPENKQASDYCIEALLQNIDDARNKESMIKETQKKELGDAKQRAYAAAEARIAAQRSLTDFPEANVESEYIKAFVHTLILSNQANKKINQLSEIVDVNHSCEEIYLAYFLTMHELENARLALSHLHTISQLCSLESGQNNRNITNQSYTSVDNNIETLKKELRDLTTLNNYMNAWDPIFDRQIKAEDIGENIRLALAHGATH